MDVQPVSGARKLRATFDLVIPGFATISRCRFLENQDGTHFIYGPAVRDAYAGWVTTVRFEPAASQKIVPVVEAMLLDLNSEPLASNSDSQNSPDDEVF